jgi:hypothetical protein
MHPIRQFGLVALLVALIWYVCPAPPLRHPPGVRVAGSPVQQDCPPRFLGQVHGYDLTAVASYEIAARVLGVKRYWDDHDTLVPYDVALGWGVMSDQAVLDRLSVSQSNRFFFYQWQGEPPLPVAEIVCHASNHHLISASSGVASAVRRLRCGQFVQMRGFLVNVSRSDGFHWNTSTSRTDSGNGACEVFYVENVIATDEVPSLAMGGR